MPDGRLGWQVKSTAMSLTAVEIECWCQISGVRLEGWQLAAIRLIDEIHVKRRNDPPAPAPPPSADGKDKSGWLAIFDAMGLRKNQ
jgi:hypothetical protein